MSQRKKIYSRPQAKKNPGGAPVAPTIVNLDVRPWSRGDQDIPKWRSALRQAEGIRPLRQLLYDLYADVELDGHVEAVTGKRKDAVKTANWQFVDKQGKAIDQVNEIIDSVGFEDLLEDIVASKFWGYSIFEPTFYQNHLGMWEMEANLLPRLNYRPEEGILAYNSIGQDGINIREGIYAKTIMEVGKPSDLGLHLKAAPYQILKRGGIGDFALFVQVFGNPIVDATWDGYDEQARLKLLEAIQNLGAGGALVRPEGTQVTLLENKSNATGDLQTNFLSFLNREISKAYLGSTETTEASQSSGYAQSKTHESQDERKNESDITFTRRILNSRFIKILNAHGFDTKGGYFIVQGEENDLSKTDTFQMHKELVKEIGLQVDDDFWYETYSIPKPDNYKPRSTEEPKPEPAKVEEKEVKLITPSDRSWLAKLFSFFDRAPESGASKKTCCGHPHTIELASIKGLNSDQLIDRAFAAKGEMKWDNDLFFHISDTLLKGFKKGWKNDFIGLQFAPGFVYGADDPALITAFEMNIFRFSAAKTLAEVQMLNDVFRKAIDFNEFHNLTKNQIEVFNKVWMQTEYTTAVLVGESASTYHRLNAQKEIFGYWMYKTQGDSLVRHEHALLDGLILPANDPRWKLIFPPNGWNCRCYIVPMMKSEVLGQGVDLNEMRERADGYIKTPEFNKDQENGFGVNRALTGEVYTNNQFYTSKLKTNRLTPEDFNLEAIEEALKVAKIDLEEYTGTATDWFAGLEIKAGKSTLKDYQGRTMVLEAKNFERHINKTDNRTILLNSLEDTIKQPDETWLRGEKDMIYIKYYQDKVMVVQSTIKNGTTFEVETWFPLILKQDVVKKWRTGVLIQSKKTGLTN